MTFIPTTPPPGYAAPSYPGQPESSPILASQWAHAATFASSGTARPTPPHPVVTSVAPTTGPNGTAITVTGSGLTRAVGVKIETDCTAVVVVNDTTVTATTAPGHHGVFPVVVTIGNQGVTGPNFTRT
jgi:hypothetical protein